MGEVQKQLELKIKDINLLLNNKNEERRILLRQVDEIDTDIVGLKEKLLCLKEKLLRCINT